MDPYFPWFSLGLTTNPFRVLTDTEWAELAFLSAEVRAWVPTGSHLQILGAAGRGKSSTLRGLTRHFQSQGHRACYEYLALGQTHFVSEPAGGTVFLLDEAQRLTLWERRRLLGLGVRLVLGSHGDFRGAFRWRGMPLTTINLDLNPRAHLEQVFRARLAYFRYGEAPVFDLPADLLAQVWTRFGTDARSAERFLYDYFQDLTRP